MAEMALLNPVINKLVDLLKEEVASLTGIHREVEGLMKELEIIQAFVEDADKRLERPTLSSDVGALKAWVRHVRQIGEEIEDVIDGYLYLLECRRRRRGLRSSLSEPHRLIKSLRPYNFLVSEIRKINKSLCQIKDRAERYGLRPLQPHVESSEASFLEGDDPRLGSLFVEKDELVGIDSKAEEFKGWLLGGEATRSVISLVGEAGIGKTTLAKRVYDDATVKAHFDCHAWITVSQSCSTAKLLRIMRRQLCPAVSYGSVGEIDTIQELFEPLRQHLKTKRYIVVFDDVWQEEFWEVIKHALPSFSHRSRVIITTRNVSIAVSCKETPFDLVEELQSWPPELAWELFCKKAFRYEFKGRCPRDLEQLSREIVAKCQGLPLVISAIAGLLSSKEKVDYEWRKVLDNLSNEFKNNPQLTSISKILCLSYYDLPYHLKSCFLYFGIFPEDYSICERTLCRLWVAEGFVKEKQGMTLEQVAEECLNDLIRRNLVGFEVRYGVDRWCRVHDLLREIIVSKANELCFYTTLDDENKSVLIGAKSHRLSIHGSAKNGSKFRRNDHGVRTIVLFNVDELTTSFMISLFNRFKFLKVLDFENAPLNKVPKELGKLLLLKYLNLRGTNVKTLPKSIGKLRNLQTLDVTNTLVRELPFEINMLQNLRHLFATSCNIESEYKLESICGVRIHEGIGRLSHLQTLMTVEADRFGLNIILELQKLRQLRFLSISKLTANVQGALCFSIEKMNHLECLELCSIRKDEAFDLHHISSPPPLQGLLLKGRLQRLPDWIPKLRNLRRMDLSFSRLVDEPLKSLKDLPNLVTLELYEAYDGDRLHFEWGGFRKLKQLHLRKLEGLRVVIIDNGALPLLEELIIGPCPLLKEAPAGFENLTNLKHLEIEEMRSEFVTGLQPHGGQDYWKIKHVPFVRFWYRLVKENRYKAYKLGESDLMQYLRVDQPCE